MGPKPAFFLSCPTAGLANYHGSVGVSVSRLGSEWQEAVDRVESTVCISASGGPEKAWLRQHCSWCPLNRWCQGHAMAPWVSGDRHTRPGPHMPHHAQTLRSSPCHPPKRSHAAALLDFAQAGPSARNALLPSTMQRVSLGGLSQHPDRPPTSGAPLSRQSLPALGAPADSSDTLPYGSYC